MPSSFPIKVMACNSLSTRYHYNIQQDVTCLLWSFLTFSLLWQNNVKSFNFYAVMETSGLDLLRVLKQKVLKTCLHIFKVPFVQAGFNIIFQLAAILIPNSLYIVSRHHNDRYIINTQPCLIVLWSFVSISFPSP